MAVVVYALVHVVHVWQYLPMKWRPSAALLGLLVTREA